MPKPRLKHNLALPKRWTYKNGAYYYLVPETLRPHWDNKIWFRLGATLAEAHESYSQHLYKKQTDILTMADLLDRFQFEYLKTLSPATQKYYFYALPMLRHVFTGQAVPVAGIEPQHAYQMTEFLLRTESPKKAKQAAEALSSALSYAVRLGVIKANPLIGQFTKPSTSGRNHAVSDAHLLAYMHSIPRKWQLYIMLKLFTKGRRKGELLRLTLADLTAEGILFTNNKRRTDRFVIGWTLQLRSIVQEILDSGNYCAPTTPLFHTRDGMPYMQEDGNSSGFDSIWQRYMKKAVTAKLCPHFTEHDLRGKAVENETLQSAAHLLRHTSTQVTSGHYRPKPERL